MFIPNDAIMISWLPFEIRIDQLGIFCDAGFETTNDGCKVFGLWTEFVFRGVIVLGC